MVVMRVVESMCNLWKRLKKIKISNKKKLPVDRNPESLPLCNQTSVKKTMMSSSPLSDQPRYPELAEQKMIADLLECDSHSDCKSQQNICKYNGQAAQKLPVIKVKRTKDLENLLAFNGTLLDFEAFDNSDVEEVYKLTIDQIINEVMGYAPDQAPEILYEMFIQNQPPQQILRKSRA